MTGVDQILSSIRVDLDVISRATDKVSAEGIPGVYWEPSPDITLIIKALGSIERALEGLSAEIEKSKP